MLVRMSEFHPFVVTADTFTWLSRQYELGLSDLSFNPDVLETLRRTQAQAAAASDYSVQDDNVAIVIVDEQDVKHRGRKNAGVPPQSGAAVDGQDRERTSGSCVSR